MAQPRIKEAPKQAGFDVTVEQVVGHVAYLDHGDHTIMQAAFQVIARHFEETGHEPATFRFPSEHEGSVIEVVIDHKEAR